jgi:hypothetical protein
MALRTLRLAAEAGEIAAIHPLPDSPWIFSRSILESPQASAISYFPAQKWMAERLSQNRA